MTRRQLLKVVVQLGGLAYAAVVGIPSLVNAAAPLLTRRPEDRWRPLGPLTGFPVGGMQQALVDIPPAAFGEGPPKRQAVFVWRPNAAEIVVFSRTCTDLGCPLNWDAGSETFLCPCHGGIFAKNGERMAGPPKLPMYRYANRIRAGILEIDLGSVPPVA